LRGSAPHRRATVSVAFTLLLALAVPPAATAEPLRMADLRVAGGEGAWHAEDSFEIDWDQIPGPPVEPRAVVYRLYDSSGRLVAGPVRETRKLVRIDSLEVPPVPGIYSLEIWLEDREGNAGPPSFAQLRFDDAEPAPPEPIAPGGWLTSSKEARLQIGHPPGPAPVSGIRGYAISLDRGGGSSPCARLSWCAVAETDLPGGIDDDEANLGALPEGTTFARVVAVSGSGVASAPSSIALEVDGTAPVVTLQGAPGGWSDGPVRLSAFAGDPLSGMAAAGPTGPFTAIAVDGGAPTVGFGDTVSTWVVGSGVHRVSYFARDAAGNAEDGVLGPRPATATIPIDEEPPQVLFSRAQDPVEPERIEATVSDRLSGPSATRGVVRLRPAGTHGRYEELPTHVLDGRLIALWDSDAYPPGKYEFLATGYDRAGNAGVGSDRERGGKMVLVNPLKAAVDLEAGFGGRQLTWHRCSRSPRGRRCHRQALTGFDSGPAQRVVPFGRATRFSGLLRSGTGRPLEGQEVEVREVFAAGSRPGQRTTVVRTDREGAFSVRLEPGPSRDVSASFAGTPTLTRAASGSVHLGVLGAVGLRASAATARVGGAPVVFSGAVGATGTAGTREGLPVELQFRYPGAGWSEFRTVETDARGNFRYAYRFSDDDSRGVHFQFRAHVTGREGWPYEPAFSRPVAVTGR
jgi:hypothetical protein